MKATRTKKPNPHHLTLSERLSRKGTTMNAANLTNSAQPVHVTAQTFRQEVIESKLPVVVDLWAEWCGPCKRIGPVLDVLAQRYAGQIKVAKVNVDFERNLAASFQIRGIPTLLIFENGAEVERVVGFHGARALEDMFAAIAEANPRPAGGVA